MVSTLIDHIARVDLRVRDIDRSLEFYRDVAGLEVAERDRERAELRALGGNAFLTLSSAGVDSPASRPATGLFHIAIRYPSRAALGDVLARLIANRERVGSGDHGVSEALYVDDPDGNGVELYRDRTMDEWPRGADGDILMTTAPVDLQGVLDSGRGEDAVGESAAPGTEMGHVHLQVSDVDRTQRFYVDGLGLDLVARMGAEAIFVSSHGYHHHLGANVWNSRGGAPTPKNHAGLDRIVLAVSGELDGVRDRLAGLGAEPRSDDGRLAVTDPDGIELVLDPGRP